MAVQHGLQPSGLTRDPIRMVIHLISHGFHVILKLVYFQLFFMMTALLQLTVQLVKHGLPTHLMQEITGPISG